MWLERAGIKKYPSSPTYDVILSEAPPALPVVSSIVRTGITPSSSTSVNFTVTFSKSITGVNTAASFSDFILSTTGLAGTSITSVTGSGSAYTVTINTGSGNGTIRLDVVDDNSIVDSVSNPLGGAAMGDGNFTTGQAYTINKDGIVTDTWALQVSPSANISQLSVQLGAQNLGQIGALTGYYLFNIPDSALQANATAAILAENPQVLCFEQQVARQQSRRGNIELTYSTEVAIIVTAATDDAKLQDNVDSTLTIDALPAMSLPIATQANMIGAQTSPVPLQLSVVEDISTQTPEALIQASPIPTQTSLAQVRLVSIPTTPFRPSKKVVLLKEPSLTPTMVIQTTVPFYDAENRSRNGDKKVAVISLASVIAGSVFFSLRRKLNMTGKSNKSK